MIITCDVGNTSIKTALFNDNEIYELQTFNESAKLFNYLNAKSPDKFALSSVVPAATEEIKGYLQKNFHLSPFIITKDVKLNLKINYLSKETLGIDRICSAEGAYNIFRNSDFYKNYSEKTFIVTIDLGTATTINVIKFPGEFDGGLIAPGVKTMFDSLSHNTAQLPIADENNYHNFIAQDTKSSIASGVINSTAGLIDRTLNHIISSYQTNDLKIYITGGNADKIIPHLNFEFSYQKALVLLGIKAIADIN